MEQQWDFDDPPLVVDTSDLKVKLEEEKLRVGCSIYHEDKPINGLEDEVFLLFGGCPYLLSNNFPKYCEYQVFKVLLSDCSWQAGKNFESSPARRCVCSELPRLIRQFPRCTRSMCAPSCELWQAWRSLANFGELTTPYSRKPSLTFTRVPAKVPTFTRNYGEDAFCMWLAFRIRPT